MVANVSGSCVCSLFEQYRDRVYWFARRSVDAATAEDVAQEVFVRLLLLPQVEARQITVSYLFKVASNIIRRDRGKCARREVANRRIAHNKAQDFREEVQEAPELSLESLPPAQDEALRLIVCEGLSYDHAARSMGTAVSTMNNWKFRGLRTLREEMEAGAERKEALAG